MKKTFTVSMKKFLIVSFAIVALGALGSFDTAWANHATIGSVSPASGNPGQPTFDVTITGSGFPSGSPVPGVDFQLGAGFGANVTIKSVQPNEIIVRLAIPNVAGIDGRKIVTVRTAGHDVARVNGFNVVLVGGGGGGGGTGGVEPVPGRFGGLPEGPQSGNELIDLIEGIADWIFVVLLVAATIFILLAAFQFISSGGNPQAMGEARSKLIWAAVGILVALLAKGLPIAIRNLVGI